MFNDSPQYGEDSPEYVVNDDSPQFTLLTPDKDETTENKGGITIQENLTGVKDRILDIIDVGKKSILDIDKDPEEKSDEKSDDTKITNSKENGKSSSDGVKIIASDISDKDLIDKMG